MASDGFLSNKHEQHVVLSRILCLDGGCCWEQKWLWEEKQLSDIEETCKAHSV